MKTSILAFVFALTLQPVLGHAQGELCVQLKQQQMQVDQALTQFVLEFPGTSVVFLGCVGASTTPGGELDYWSMLGCGGMYCLMNHETCIQAYQRLSPIISTQFAIDRARSREPDCS